MSFRDCIQAALETGAIDRYEAEDLTRRWEALERAEKSGEEAPGFARLELNRQLSEEAREAARVKGLQLKASSDARKDINRYALDRGPDVGGAVFRMFENQGDAGFSSVRYQMSALRSAALSEMEAAVHAFRRSGLTLQRRGNALLDEVARAAFGGSNDPGAQALYKAILKPMEKLRELFNEAGGNIAWRDKWGLPMRHDAGALMAASFDKWREFIEPRLNWDEMKHGVTGATILTSEREAVLRHVWESVVTDGWNTRDPGSPGFAAKYRQRQDARFLVFRDGDAWLDYNKAFGTGDVWKTVTGHISSLSRDVALMRRFGPNPTSTVDWLKNVVLQEAMRAKIGAPSLFERSRSWTGVKLGYEASARAQQETIDALYSLARGDTGVADGAVADVFAAVRNVQYAAKLGGAVITHAILNPIQQDLVRAARGVNRLSQITSMAKAFSGANEREATRAGLVAADALHVLEQGAREAAATSRLRSLSAWLPEATVRWSGLEAFVGAQRRAFGFDLMAHFGDRLGRPWSELEDRTREMLSGYGIRKDEWAAIRLAEPYAPQAAAPFLRFNEIAEAGRAKAAEIAGLGLGVDEAGAPAYMRDLAFKYLGLIHGETERAAPSSSWRVRAKIVGNSKEGTFWGEARRSFGMFKGFAGSAMVGNMQLLKQELARDKTRGAAAAGGYLLAMAAGGVLVQQLKAIASGKDLKDTNPTTRQGLDTWASGMLTSGGLGIFGDFLASDRSAYGHGPLETAAGPMVTGAIDAYTAARTIFEGKKTPGQKLAAGAINLLRNNTPVASTHWALRAAYNRILLDQLQYLADPAARSEWQRAESRLRKETAQGMWWPRGEAAPTRAPQVAKP
jgi:hypothetical protein